MSYQGSENQRGREALNQMTLSPQRLRNPSAVEGTGVIPIVQHRVGYPYLTRGDVDGGDVVILVGVPG